LLNILSEKVLTSLVLQQIIFGQLQ